MRARDLRSQQIWRGHKVEDCRFKEVGDIVEDEYNKSEVAFVKDDKIYCNDYNLDDSLITLREQDIKAILTREQFEANCYKVGGEDGIQIYDME